MHYRSLHSWAVTPVEAIALQRQLREKLELRPPGRPIRFVAGADISYERFSSIAHAAIVVIDLKSLEPVDSAVATAEMQFPYVPGLLTFREGPILLAAWEKLNTAPDAVMFDGQGIAHPRRLGIAAHMGLILELPSLGCGKTRLTGSFEEPGWRAGDWSPLVDQARDPQEIIGAVLRTQSRVSPVFVSPGHLMDLKLAIRLTMMATGKYRLPEPTRRAHQLANETRRAALKAA